MPDREKVIAELQEYHDREWTDERMDGLRERNIRKRVTGNALVILKEQEAVEPTLIREGRNKYYNNYVCPRCDNDVVYEQNYCSECGVRFLWEGR